MGARQASGVEPGASHMAGQFDPLRLAWLIAQRHPNSGGTNPRQLVQVSIYRGLPSSSVDPVGYGAVRRQVARWRSSSADGGPQLDINLRPLDYSLGRPREKGIDVLLALDLAFGAAHGAFDVAVLFSGDSDLLPALERVSASGVQCETASWRGGWTPAAQEVIHPLGASADTARLSRRARSHRLSPVDVVSRSVSGLHRAAGRGRLCPIFPAVHHRPAEVHWRGFALSWPACWPPRSSRDAADRVVTRDRAGCG